MWAKAAVAHSVSVLGRLCVPLRLLEASELLRAAPAWEKLGKLELWVIMIHVHRSIFESGLLVQVKC